MILNKPSFRLMWYHKDELQIVGVFIVLVLFFSRSLFLSSVTLTAILCAVAGLYAFRFVRLTLLEKTHIPLSSLWHRHVESRLLFTSPERSRIAMTLLSCVVLGILCLHRIALARTVAGFETPTDVYWILFLAWYWVVWTFVLGYLIFRAITNKNRANTGHPPFFEGLVASLFFYHGLPPRQRLITFASAFVLGGLPTFVATGLLPDDPTAYTLAGILVLPVIILTLAGAWYATRWHVRLAPERPE